MYDYLLNEAKLKSSERTDFGLPSKKKYPMPDEAHVRAAIRMFNHCDPEDEAELARNIKKYMKKYGIEDIEVGENNRFSKYYKKPVQESVIEKVNDMNDKIRLSLESVIQEASLNSLSLTNDKLNKMSIDEKRKRSKVPKELWDEYANEIEEYDRIMKGK